MLNPNRALLREIITEAISPFKKDLDILSQKIDEIKQSQGSMYNRETIDAKLRELTEDVNDIKKRQDGYMQTVAVLIGAAVAVIQILPIIVRAFGK